MEVNQQSIAEMQARITDEIFFALGFTRSGVLRRILGWMFYQPTRRFARMFANADDATGKEGLPGGARALIQNLGIRLRVHGGDKIPGDGPLIVVSNHPGAYDSIAIASCVPRSDLKILVADTGFYHTLPNINKRLIYAGNDLASRMSALRQAMRWLQTGGALLQFGSGTIDADPSVESSAASELEKWSPSLEIMLRKAPKTQVVLTIASRVLLRQYLEHPLARLYQQPLMRRRLAEFIQVIQQLIKPESVQAQACLSFAPPVSVAELIAEAGDNNILPVVLNRARGLLDMHNAMSAG